METKSEHIYNDQAVADVHVGTKIIDNAKHINLHMFLQAEPIATQRGILLRCMLKMDPPIPWIAHCYTSYK